MKFIIVTGLSGAGKTQVLNAFEDMGDFCVDNMPPELLPKFAEIYHKSANPDDRAAIACDIRSRNMFGELLGSLDKLSELGYDCEILFLDANDETIIKRYKETRRTHPLAESGRIIDGIQKERRLLEFVKKNASKIVDSSTLTATQLKEQISAIYARDSRAAGMAIHIISFGFKHGIPLDADLLFDVRFLPNPFYVPELKERTGLESCVRDYVMAADESSEFLDKLCDMVDFLIPRYKKEGKSQLVIAIGCTGGHHRSVTIAEGLYKMIDKNGYNVMITHRDIQK